MSDQTTQSVSGNNKRSGKTVQSYQSVWMARWSGTNSIAEAETRKHSVSEYGTMPNGLEISRSVKGPGIIEDRNSDLGLSSRSSGSKVMHNSRLGKCQNTGEMQALRPLFGLGVERGKGKAPVSSSIGKSVSVSRNQLPCANMKMLEENCHEVGPSANLLCGKQMKSSSHSHASANVRFRESDRSVLFDAPSTNDHQWPTQDREWFQKMHKSSGFFTLFRGEHIASGETESKKSHCVGELETVRVCTMVDALATTHSLLITKKSEVNLLEEDETFGSSSKMNESTSSDFHGASPFLGLGKQGVKLQSLSSSSEKINFGDEASKIAAENESSAKTDTLEMNILKKKKPNAGSSSIPSTKDSKTESILSPPTDLSSSGDMGCQLIPDINVALPALPAAGSSENMCRSSSRTETLEMEIPLDHAQQPKSSFKFNLNDSPDEHPSNRWIKRLKLSSSNSSGLGTKSSNLSKNSSHGKTSQRLRTILQSSITSSPGHNNADSSKVDEDSKIDSPRKAKSFLLSNAWTKRLLHKGSKAARKKTEMIFAPQSSKLALEDLEMKQFPSIAAMALVGKTMSGFRPCETQKKGAFTVWNAKSF